MIQKTSMSGSGASINLPRSTTYLVDSATPSGASKTSQKSTPSRPTNASTIKPVASNKQLSPIAKEGTFTKTQSSSSVPPPKIDSPTKPATNSKTTSLAALKQQRRAELKQAQASGMRTDDDLIIAAGSAGDTSITSSDYIITGNQRSLEAKLKEARKSGQLNLSNYGLVEGNSS